MDEIQERMLNLGIEIVCIEKNDKIFVYHESDLDYEIIRTKFKEVTGQNDNVFKIIKIPKIPRTTSLKVNHKELEKIS